MRYINDIYTMDQRWINDGSKMKQKWINDGSTVEQQRINDASTIDQQWVDNLNGLHMYQGCIYQHTLSLLDATCIKYRKMSLSSQMQLSLSSLLLFEKSNHLKNAWKCTFRRATTCFLKFSG